VSAAPAASGSQQKSELLGLLDSKQLSRNTKEATVGEQLDLPYVIDSDTSRDAADSMEGVAGYCRRKILRRVRDASYGITCDEIEVALDMSHQNVSARLRELALANLIYDSGERRQTRSGRTARVYLAAPK
jgi:DNA-binding transcriptional ArsR family regulator